MQLASDSAPIPFLKQTILQLDSNPQAQFYFQLVAKSNPNEEVITSKTGDYKTYNREDSKPNSEEEEAEVDEEGEEEEDVEEDLENPQTEWRTSKKAKPTRPAQTRSRLTESQSKEYFTKFLRARKLQAGNV